MGKWKWFWFGLWFTFTAFLGALLLLVHDTYGWRVWGV